jgi:hypothetical protein
MHRVRLSVTLRSRDAYLGSLSFPILRYWPVAVAPEIRSFVYTLHASIGKRLPDTIKVLNLGSLRVGDIR